MANFTEIQPIRYKDYVSTAPIDAMTTVGMQREQQLAQGIQKVNDYVTKVAGVDIIRDVDKQYLQSSLKSLTQGVTKTLSGDFSDARIVNQITGAATQIYKDPIVQNGIVSTANLRKGQSEMDAARKTGKSNPNNEDYFINKAQKYIASQNPEESFNDTYKPYVDVLAKVTELTSKAGIDSKVVDYIYNNKGLPTDVMTEQEYKTNMPKIKAAIDAVFADGSVRQQLQIDGWAKYRNVDATELFNPFVDKYNALGNKITQDQMDLQVLTSASNIKPEQKLEYEEKEKELKQVLVNSKTEFDQLQNLALTNPDGFKELLYSTDLKDNLINTLSTTSTSTTYKTNPAMEQYMKIVQLNWDKEKEQNSNYYKADTKKLEWAKFDLDYPIGPDGQRHKAEGTGKSTKFNPNDPINLPTPSGGNTTDEEKVYNLFDENVKNLGNEVNRGAIEIFTDYLSLVNDGKTKDGKSITPEVAMQYARTNAAANKEKVEDYILRFALNANSKLEDSKLKAPAQIQAKIDEFKSKQELHETYILANAAGHKAGKEAVSTMEGDTKLVVSNKFSANAATEGNKGADFSFMQPQSNIKLDRNPKDITNEGASKSRELYVKTRNAAIAKIIPAFNNLSTQGVDKEASKAKVLEFVNTTSSLAGVPSNQREAIVEALTKPEAGVTFQLHQPMFVGQPWTSDAIISYKGKEYTIPNVPTTTTGKTFQPFEVDPDEILMQYLDTRSTSIINPNASNAHQSAKYGSSKFVSLSPKSPHVVKGNMAYVRDPNGGADGSQLILYVKEGNGEFKNIQGPVIYPSIQTPNPTSVLKQYISNMTDSDIQRLLPKNK